MAGLALSRRQWLGVAAVGVVLILGIAVGLLWGDLMRTALDPKVPFQTYAPPPAPDYAKRDAWYLLPANPERLAASDPAADLFFVGPTTYDGGRDWNAPIGEPRSDRLFRRVMAPNYAGPFERVARIFAPRYRQASLYTFLSLREDAFEARQFAYGDVLKAFHAYLDRDNQGRPFFLVGVEQGGSLAERLLAEEIARNPQVRARLAGVYLIETAVPAAEAPITPCTRKGEPGCLAAWISVFDGEQDRAQTVLARAMAFNAQGELEGLNGRPTLCFNPILGETSDVQAPARLNLGAANATGLEWDARPAFLSRQVSAQCRNGVLFVSRPKSGAFRPQGSWTDRRKAPGYNLFYADLEADAKARLAGLTGH
jgi:hypothetical protein